MGLEDGSGGKVHKINDHSSSSLPSQTSLEAPLDILRCAPMSLLQLYIPAEAAQTTVAELGSVGLVQFRDVSQDYNLGLFFINFRVYLFSCIVA